MYYLNDIRVSKAIDPPTFPPTTNNSSINLPNIEANRPPPLPYRRNIDAPRAQPQSRLLARLSPELRLMVWESVLGNQRIHIIQRSQQRLGYVVCPSPLHGTRPSSPKQNHAPRTSEQFCDICHGSGIPQPAKEADLTRARNKVILLGLALTCRQMYGPERPSPISLSISISKSMPD
jgi:hypothetical protein